MSLREPKSPLRSPTNFSHRGFQPLRNENDADMGYDSSIQMQAMPRRSGSSTGARKKGEGTNLPSDFSTANTFKDEEKKGFFRRSPGGRRKDPNAPKANTRVNTDGEEVSVNVIGRFYNRIVNFSIVTRYFVYVLPIGLALAAPIVYYAITNRDDYITDAIGVRTWLFFLWIEIVWLSLWVSKLMAKFVPWLFMTLIGVVSSGTKKYALILKAVEIELSLVGWSVTSLATFTALTSERINDRAANSKPGVNGIVADPHWIVVMQRILVPIFISTLLLLGEKMIIQLISVNYHRRSFDQRIKESKHTIHLLGLLYDASRTLFPTYCQEFAEEDYVINDTIEAVLAKSGVHRRRGSRTPLKVLGDIGRVGDKVTSLFGNIASEITGKQVFNPTSAHSVVVEALEKPRSSEALARRLWMSFVVEGKDSLYADDIEEVLGPSRQQEAEEAFNALDGDGNGDISLEEMILKVVEVGRSRKAIAASMHDVGQAIGVLDNILIWVLLVIVVFIFVAFQNTNFLTTLATAGTTLLSLSFVFAATTQEFLGSCIFLFVKHPYDVGDRVDINGGDGNHLVVEQISLLYTLFKRIDNQKIVQIPNIVLNNQWVENVTRSKAMKEPLEMSISFDTSFEDIELLRLEMEKFVRHPDNARDFQPEITLEAAGIGSMDKLLLKINICHKSNWHNETIRAARRSKFMCALVLALRKVPIYGPGGGFEPLGGPTNPGYTVAVGDSWAANAREKVKAEKDAQRLASAKSGHEANAADALNARNPLSDSAHPSDDNGNYPGSREDAEQRKRDSDIEQLRDGLKKSKSNRGVRRAGDHIPDEPPRVPDVSVTGPTSYQGYQSSPYGNREIDEEAEMGIRQTSSTGPLGGSSSDTFASPFGSPQPPAGGYSIYPQQSYQQQPQQQYAQYPQSGQLQPLGSSPPRQRAPSPPQGGRSRNLSLSVRPGGNGGGSSG
ncbi:hypothetical protein HYFRA_00014213 [Hymenoscyphus fraxineus]|uniref:Mechanosensitive ion channel protein n=1 Tax=Hymenoscyphus fraxineus TaxID=746836 RepID=A0A9N9PPX0_9HELO|nr:hypothetical protein HYFRA_00014213 [Hymenoscyphus fraxineus]